MGNRTAQKSNLWDEIFWHGRTDTHTHKLKPIHRLHVLTTWRGVKRAHRRTDVRTEIWTSISAMPLAADKNTWMDFQTSSNITRIQFTDLHQHSDIPRALNSRTFSEKSRRDSDRSTGSMWKTSWLHQMSYQKTCPASCTAVRPTSPPLRPSPLVVNPVIPLLTTRRRSCISTLSTPNRTL